MIICEQRTWTCGPFTIRQCVRADNPAFARYIILRRDKIVGCSFSVPDRGWCEFVERFHANGELYAEHRKLKKHTYRMPERARQNQLKATRSKRVRLILAGKA